MSQNRASDFMLNMRRIGNADIISFAGEPSTNYEFQFSTDLKDWKHAKNILTDTNGESAETFFYDAESVFYRAKKDSNALSGLVTLKMDVGSPFDRTIRLSETAPTRNVVLAAFDVRPERASGVLRRLQISASSSGGVSAFDFSLKIIVGNMTYSPDILSSGENDSVLVTFQNLEAFLPSSGFVPVIVIADFPADADHIMKDVSVSVSLNAGGSAGGAKNNPMIQDQSFEALEVADTVLVGAIATFSY